MKRIAFACFLAAAAGGHAAAATLTGYGPSAYLSFADSPFSGGNFSFFHLEDLEDSSLNVPGVKASGGVVAAPAMLTDSVDADDRAIDGSGTGGHSWYSFGQASLTFSFDAQALGGLPTHAGIVWTDVGNSTLQLGSGNVLFEAFDANNVLLGSLGPFVLGDGSAAGGTAEDRFLGVSYVLGISAIRISMTDSTDWEVDHLQYGAARPIPEPGTLSLVLGGLSLLAVLRRRR